MAASEACCVCGCLIRSPVEDDATFLQDEKWQKYYEDPGVLFMDAKELEAKYFNPDMPTIWNSLHRLIVYDYLREEFILTGIGQTFDSKFMAPKDTSQAFIGKPPKGRDDLTKIYDDCDINWWTPPHPFEMRDWRERVLAMHMGCWRLAQWLLGSGIEKNLELFAAITLRNVFKLSMEMWDGLALPADISERPGMPEKCAYSNLGTDKYQKSRQKNTAQGCNKRDRDPYRNTQAQTVIDSSRVIKKTTPFPLWHSRISELPTEILFEVLDLLDCKEISAMGVALRIMIPDCYWRSRAALNLIEMDEIAGEDLNWQYLCSKIEAVSASSFLFQSRRYIVDLLRNDIKPEYLRNLETRGFPRLEEVITECQDKAASEVI